MDKMLDEYELAKESGCYIQRDIYSKLLYWKEERARNHVACFLKGPRRVGKSVLALDLAHNHYRSFIRISFDRASEKIKGLFTDSLEDLDLFYDQLMVDYDTVLYPGESIIILDEIQLFKPARQAIKTLLLDGRYDILETGSLASIVKTSEEEGDYLLPSEEMEVEVCPISFKEYLRLRDEQVMLNFIETATKKHKPYEAALRNIFRRFREYMLVGGMPKPMRTFLLSGDYKKVEEEKREILALYRSDVMKQEKVNPAYAMSILDLIPSELSRHDSRFRFSHINKNARERDYFAPLKWLCDAEIVHLSYPITEPSPLPLLTIDPREFKAYLFDTGLLYSLSYLSAKQDDLFYKRLLLDTLHTNEGMFAENYVAQALHNASSKICYYSKRDEKSYKTIMEVDFLFLEKNKITPIEVKSSSDYSHSSLLKFKKTFQKLVNEGIVLYDGDFMVKDGVRYYPLFALEWLLD